MTITANASPSGVGEHRKHLGIGRFVQAWSWSPFRRTTSGALSANGRTSISMKHIIRLAGSTMLEAQGKSHTDMKRRATVYQLTNRLRDGYTAYVSADEIVTTVSAWLDELGAASPLVEDLAHAVRAGDWPKAHALADYLSLEITVTQ